MKAGISHQGLGYADASYATALGEFGRPIALEASGGWLLERPIRGAADRDAMGSYPLFACRDWAALGQDLGALRNRLVSVSLVADPFGDYSEPLLTDIFESVRLFKNHFVADLSCPAGATISPHHRYYARRALKRVRIEVSRSPGAYLDEWAGLYSGLVERHDIGGMRRFSMASFAGQMKVPGAVLFRALLDGVAVGAQLWYEVGTGDDEPADSRRRPERVAYSHLAASSEAGYAVRVSYALYWAAIEYFRARVDWLDLGAGAGLGDRQDGLTAFKSGWATGTRPVYLCGSVLWPERYDVLAGAGAHGTRDGRGTGYFPAYRAGEFEGRDGG